METMSCEQARILFDEKLDGILDESEDKRLSAHLAACEICRREYEALEKTHQHLAALAVEIPPELSVSVMERIKKEPRRHTEILRRLRPLVALPVAALLCVALLHSPLLDGMFAAKEDMHIEMSEGIMNNADRPALGGKDEKPKHDDILEDANPEESAPLSPSYPVEDTSLILHLTDGRVAHLLNEESGKSETVAYTKNENVITIERNGKKADLILSGGTLIPTDKAVLDALLSE